MSLISDLYLFLFNQLVLSPLTSLTLVSLLSYICAQAKPLFLIGILTNLIYFPPDIIHPVLICIPSSHHYYPFSIKISFSSFPLPWNCGTLFHSTLEYLHPFPPYSTNFILIRLCHPWLQSTSNFHLVTTYH